MKVLKFGGSSLASPERVANVLAIVAAASEADPVGVVVSAVGGVTDLLLSALENCTQELAAEIVERYRNRHLQILADLASTQSEAATTQLEALCTRLAQLLSGVVLLGHCPPRTRDEIASLGERASVVLVAAGLRTKTAVHVIDPQHTIITDESFGEARVQQRQTYERISTVGECPERVLLMGGFIGGSSTGQLTTLGRNGSDYSATLLAAGLQADCVEIWTDVDGVYSADPRLVPSAFVLSELTYREAMELAHFGAKVIHPRTLAPVARLQIPVHIRNTLNPSALGTRIAEHATPPPHAVRALTVLENMALIDVAGTGMAGVPGLAARACAALAAEQTNIVLMSQASSEKEMCFAVHATEVDRARTALERELVAELETGAINAVIPRHNLAIVSAVGSAMSGQRGVAGMFFTALANAGANIVAMAQGASELSMSCVIDAQASHHALTAVHNWLFDRTQEVEVYVIGAGLVGSALLDQMRDQHEHFATNKMSVRVCAVATSSRLVHKPEGLELSNWRQNLADAPHAAPLEAVLAAVRERDRAGTVLVDTTADDRVARSYEAFFKAGAHVVTPNKVANTLDMATYRSLRKAASRARVRFLYETTVGAGLPIIETLRSMLATGDRLVRFSGILSGSLSLICGLLDDGHSFSQAVATAHQKGFTEPNPLLDLSGQDVARKVLTLARETGLALELADVDVQPLAALDGLQLPENACTETVLAALAHCDDAVAEILRDAKDRDHVLRYVATIDGSRCSVGPCVVPRSDALAAVRDGENVAVFLTQHYSPTPLVVRGYGAGPQVTASGVLWDILRTAQLATGDLP